MNHYKILKNLKKYFMLLLGFLIFSLFIYFRFIRERLPREIPFHLTTLGFIILVEICCIYGYILLATIKPPQKENEILKQIIEVCYTPLKEFDNWLKEKSFIKNNYVKLISWIAYNYLYLFKNLTFFIIFWMFPRLCLITVFFIDIFFFHKLEYIYIILPLGIILFLRRYIIYSIKSLNDNFYNMVKPDIFTISTKYVFGVHPSEWPENYDPEGEDEDDVPPTMALELDIFIKFYITNKIENNDEYTYTLRTNIYFYNKYLDKDKERKEAIIVLKNNIKDMLQLGILLAYDNQINTIHKGVKRMKIFVYSMYLLCWFYILYVSCSLNNIIDVINIIELVQPITLNDNELSEIFIP